MEEAAWRETYFGGSVDAERRKLEELAREVGVLQRANAAREPDGNVRRAFHAKTVAGIVAAELRVSPSLSHDIARGVLQPGAVHPAVVRFSNASGIVRSDRARDLRGVAIRVQPAHGAPQDFLLTNAPASHARDGVQFMAAAKAGAAGSTASMLLALVREVGLREAIRIAAALRSATAHEVESVVAERYWSRAPFAIGPVAVKLRLVPVAAPARPSPPAGDDHLRRELAERLREASVELRLEAQRYVDDVTTPIEDGTVEWEEANAPFETVAVLVLPQSDIETDHGRRADDVVEALAFSPWTNPDEIRPIGGLNRARRLVYEASAHNREAKVQ